MPRISLRLLTALVAITLAAAACGGSDDSASSDEAAPTGAWPHDFEAELIGGDTIDAGDYEGQDLVLWFWAPW